MLWGCLAVKMLSGSEAKSARNSPVSTEVRGRGRGRRNAPGALSSVLLQSLESQYRSRFILLLMGRTHAGVREKYKKKGVEERNGYRLTLFLISLWVLGGEKIEDSGKNKCTWAEMRKGLCFPPANSFFNWQ